MKMENPYNKGDQLFIYAKTPFNTNGAAKGLVLGLSESLRSPCSFKVIFTVENSAYRLAANIKKTQKRANALKNITIPMYTALVYNINNALEEKD